MAFTPRYSEDTARLAGETLASLLHLGLDMENTPVEIEEEETVSIPAQTNRELVFSYKGVENMAKERWFDRWLEKSVPGALIVLTILFWLAVVGVLFGGCGVDMGGLDGAVSADVGLVRPLPDGGRSGVGGQGGAVGGSVGGHGGIPGIPETGGQGGRVVDYSVCPAKAAGCIWVGICGGKTCCIGPEESEAYKCR